MEERLCQTYQNWGRGTMSINSVAKLCFLFSIDNDWTFDELISGMYGCEVHSFDPRLVSYVLIYEGRTAKTGAGTRGARKNSLGRKLTLGDGR